MASFTDAITQFNPYVSQLPVEAMMKVGMIKQQQYEEGYKKIQGEIDRVAGLDIIKDVDKNYLQSKLDELGGNLRTFAAGDFSNFQLVNSVGGMARQVGKDENIQNAVASTAWYKKQQAAIAEAKKKGKSDKNNEDYFYNDANKWLTDGKVGSKFSSSFVEYTDVMKTIRENVTAAGIDSKYIEQMFETDEKGNILRDKNNHPIPARVMTTETLDTNAEKVKAIVANVMSQGDVQQQVQIDGWANTRNVPVESIYQTFENDFNVRDADANQALLTLQAQIDATNTTPEEKKALLEVKTSIEEKRNRNRKTLDALKEKSINDPEQFKIDYYKDSYINNLIDGFTTIKSKKENKDSPLTKVLQWEEQMDFNRNKEAFDRKIALASAERDRQRLIIEQNKFEADYEFDPTTGKYKKIETGDDTKKKKGDVNTTTTSEINSENKGESVDGMSNYKNITSDLQAQAQLKGFDLIYNYLYKINGGKNRDGSPFTRGNAQQSINAWAKSNGETPYQFIIRFSGDLKNKSELSGVKLSVQDLEKVDEINKLHNDVTTRLAVTEDIYNQAKTETGYDYKKLDLTDIQPLPLNNLNKWFEKNVGIVTKQGPVITVQDQMDYMTWYNGGILKNTPEVKLAVERLEKKYGDGGWNGFEQYAGKTKSDLLYKLRSLSSDDKFKKYQKAISEKFKKVNVVSDNFSSTLMGTDDELKLAKARLAPLFNATRMDEEDQQAITAVLAEPGGLITYDAHRPTKEGEAWTGTIFVTDKKGVKHSVDVDQANLEIITGREFKPYIEDGLRARANVSQFGSTNLGAYTTDANAYQSAAIKSGRFAGLKNSDYTAYADVLPLSGGKLGIAIYAKDRTMSNFERIEMVPVKTTINGRPVYFTDYNEIYDVIPNVTPAMIKDGLIKTKQKK